MFTHEDSRGIRIPPSGIKGGVKARPPAKHPQKAESFRQAINGDAVSSQSHAAKNDLLEQANQRRRSDG